MTRAKAFLLVAAVLLSGAGCSQDHDVSPPSGDQAASRIARAAVAFAGRVVFQSDQDGDNEIYVLTTDGLTQLTHNTWSDEYPLWSPDGRWISFGANPDGRYDIFIMAADGSGVRRITSSPRDEVEQAWSPDGQKLAYTEEVKRPFGKKYSLWVRDLATDAIERLASEFPDSAALPNFSPTSPLLAFTGKKTPGWDVFVYDLAARTFRALTEGGHACRPHFSPDGRTIAYVSHEADRRGDIWLMAADGGGKRRLTVRDETSDYFPTWSPDGRAVLFCSSGETMYAHEGRWGMYLVDVATGRVTLFFDGPGRDVFPDWHK